MKATLTEYYVLVETDDIDLSTLRAAVEEFKTQQAYRIDELPLELEEAFLKGLQDYTNN